MLDEVLAGLNVRPGGAYVDCTLGGAATAKDIKEF
jgi:16S rRNA C1402 N4-methylase RsmH